MTGSTTPDKRYRRKNTIKPPQGYISRQETADRVNRSIHTIDKWAVKKLHLTFIKSGGEAFYKETDVDQYKAEYDKKKQMF